jgi:uncharacterized protein (TIGR00369 family)
MKDSLAALHDELQAIVRHAGSGATFPPNCFVAMKAEFGEYESRRALTISVPVLEESLNPLRDMQGGFLVAAFDNAFGPLSYLSARAPCVTLNMTTQFIRSVGIGDVLTIRAEVVSRGRDILQMKAEAHSSKGRLVATATASAAVLRNSASGQGNSL